LLTAQRDRVDRLFLDRKTWDLDAWRERYLDHPIVGVIARRLVWRFTRDGQPATGPAGRPDRRREDREVTGLDRATTVELWHPIEATTDEVMAWRDWLERHQVASRSSSTPRSSTRLTTPSAPRGPTRIGLPRTSCGSTSTMPSAAAAAGGTSFA